MPEKLIPDSETFQEKRPTKITDQQREEFIRELAEDILSDGHSESAIEVIIHDLKGLNLNENGYYLAKKLEDGRASYNLNAMFVEFLDCVSSDFDDIHKDNVKDWVKAKNIKPKFLIGTKLLVKETAGYECKKDAEIFITGINPERAYYTIHKDKDHNGGYVYDFEKIEENCEAVPF